MEKRIQAPCAARTGKPQPRASRNYIKEMRDKRELSQEQLAKLCGPGWQQQRINRFEARQQEMKWTDMKTLARALGCNPLDLVDWP